MKWLINKFFRAVKYFFQWIGSFFKRKNTNPKPSGPVNANETPMPLLMIKSQQHWDQENVRFTSLPPMPSISLRLSPSQFKNVLSMLRASQSPESQQHSDQENTRTDLTTTGDSNSRSQMSGLSQRRYLLQLDAADTSLSMEPPVLQVMER